MDSSHYAYSGYQCRLALIGFTSFCLDGKDTTFAVYRQKKSSLKLIPIKQLDSTELKKQLPISYFSSSELMDELLDRNDPIKQERKVIFELPEGEKW